MKKIFLAAVTALMLSTGIASVTNAQTKTVSIENFNTETPVSAQAISAETPYYDKAGNLVYVVRRYMGTALPEGITSIIKNTYADYAIVSVEEVAIPSSSSVYFVHVANDKKLKTIRVHDGNSEIISEYKKG